MKTLTFLLSYDDVDINKRGYFGRNFSKSLSEIPWSGWQKASSPQPAGWKNFAGIQRRRKSRKWNQDTQGRQGCDWSKWENTENDDVQIIIGEKMKELMLTTELLFWDMIIPLMKQSKITQWIIRVAYPFVEGLNFVQITKTVTITCVSGFLLGWLAFYTYYLSK